MKLITFVIPTIGRETLQRTIVSLKNQTIDDWHAIVVFDGIDKIDFHDERITSIKIPKAGNIQVHKKFGNVSNAGLVRNEAFKYVESKWIGFVDDDDIIYQDYIEKLKIEEKDVDLILFRMNADRVVPSFEHKDIRKNEVGISFAVKTDMVKLHNLKFENCGTEDYVFFNNCISYGLTYKISEHIVYEVCSSFKEKDNIMQAKISFFGTDMSQTENMPVVLNKFLNSINAENIIEIGTYKGGLSVLFALYSISKNNFFVTYDIKDCVTNLNLFNVLNINRRIADVFKAETTQEIISHIKRKGTTVLFCDGGNKIKEFNLFSSFLKQGDFILAHDYAKDANYFKQQINGKVWNWCEITDCDIQKCCDENFLEKIFLEFDSVAVTCRIKK